MSNFELMLEQLQRQPKDELLKAMAADLLEELGKPAHAEMLRSSIPDIYNCRNRAGFYVVKFARSLWLEYYQSDAADHMFWSKAFYHVADRDELFDKLIQEGASLREIQYELFDKLIQEGASLREIQ